MNHRARFLFSFLTILLTWAAADSHTLTLEECIDSALSLNTSLRAQALEVERAKTLKGTAFDPENTSVMLKQETTGGGGPENGVMISQEFEFPSVYAARSKTLSAKAQLEGNNYSVATNELISDVSSEYLTAAYLNRLIQINDSLDYHYREFLRIAKARYEAGECGVLEVMNAERVLEQSRLDRSAVYVNFQASLERLRNLTGCTVPFTVNPMAADEDIDNSAVRFNEFIYGSTPRGEVNASLIRAAEADVALEKQKFLPGINLGVTLQAFIKGFNPYNVVREPFRPGNFMGFEAGITLPVFFWAQKSRLKAANTQLNIARLQQQYDMAEAETEYRTLQRQCETQWQNLIYLKETSLPRSIEMRRIADISYRLGEIDYMEYISNIETAFGILKDYAGAVNDYNQTLIQLNRLTGKR